MLPFCGDIHWPIRAGDSEFTQDGIHVWYADLDSLHDKLPQEILSTEELTRAKLYRFRRDARHFIARRCLLRCLLSAYLDISPDGIVFQAARQGKPFLANPGIDGLTFSVSHSSASALFAISRGSEVGVDLEKERDDLDPMALATQFFAPYERLALELLPSHERKAAFFRTWTRKEAWLKAVGCGLSLPLTDFLVSIEPEKPVLLDCPLQYGLPQDWRLIDLPSYPGFAAAVACKANCATIHSGAILAN